jgi:hypothetical protein
MKGKRNIQIRTLIIAYTVFSNIHPTTTLCKIIVSREIVQCHCGIPGLEEGDVETENCV